MLALKSLWQGALFKPAPHRCPIPCCNAPLFFKCMVWLRQQQPRAVVLPRIQIHTLAFFVSRWPGMNSMSCTFQHSAMVHVRGSSCHSLPGAWPGYSGSGRAKVEAHAYTDCSRAMSSDRSVAPHPQRRSFGSARARSPLREFRVASGL